MIRNGTTMKEKAKPQSEEEWIVQAINIHGFFFESWCRTAIESLGRWKVLSTYEPVSVSGKESNLDIWAEYRSSNSEHILNILIECKKANPEFVKWIFFPRMQTPKTNAIVVSEAVIGEDKNTPTIWRAKTGPSQKFPFKDISVAMEAREVRGEYMQTKDDKTKTRTANASIMEASYQIALATQSIFAAVRKNARELTDGARTSVPWKHHTFLPIIVTTAELFICGFDPNEISDSTGEIPWGKVVIEETP